MAHSRHKVYDVEKSFTDLFWARYIIPLIWSSFAAAPPPPQICSAIASFFKHSINVANEAQHVTLLSSDLLVCALPQCSVTCGEGVERRLVTCRIGDQCSREKPEAVRPCRLVPCHGEHEKGELKNPAGWKSAEPLGLADKARQKLHRMFWAPLNCEDQSCWFGPRLMLPKLFSSPAFFLSLFHWFPKPPFSITSSLCLL